MAHAGGAGRVEDAPVLLDLVGVVTADQEHRLDAVERRARASRASSKVPTATSTAPRSTGSRTSARTPVGTGEMLDDGAADLAGRSGDEDHRGGASPGGLWRISRMTPACSAVS